jgi:hypothetical protein
MRIYLSVVVVLSLLLLASTDQSRPSQSGTVSSTKSREDGQRAKLQGSVETAFGTPLAQPDVATQRRVLDSYGQIPLSFEANQGQTEKQVRFLTRGSGYTLFLTDDAAVLTLQGAARQSALVGGNQSIEDPAFLRMNLVGANHSPKVSGLDEQQGKTNYFTGNDPTKWRTNVVNYSRVKYNNAYPGIDLIYYGNQRQLEYDFVVAPGANPRAILLDLEQDCSSDSKSNGRLHLGTHCRPPLRIARNGDLVATIQGREVRFSKPILYQGKEAFDPRRRDEDRRSVMASSAIHGRWVLKGDSRVGFEVGAYDTTKPLIIDPALNYSTYLGGSLFTAIYGVAVDSSGAAYVTGGVTSTDFPVTPGVVQPKYSGNHDAFVTKLNPTGTGLVYSTYLGGSGIDHGSSIAVDAFGNAYVAGTTSSKNFPVTPGAFQTVCRGCGGTSPDGFVSKLNPAGSALVYSTFLGGSGYEHFAAMTIDGSGDAYVTGFSCSLDYPTTAGAFQTTFKGSCTPFGGNVVVSELNATGSALVYSTYLGGTGTDDANAVIVDASGNTYVAGYSTSTDFPTTAGAFQTHNAGKNDVFVTKLNSAGAALLYSTYIGGSSDDQAWGLRVDSVGNAYVVGQTTSTNFPTTAGAFQTSCNSCTGANPQTDGFVTKLDSTGSSQVYSTYLGGSGQDVAFAISLGSMGDAYVAGETNSKDFKTTPGAFQPTVGGSTNAFITRLHPTGNSAIYSTYFANNSTTILGISVNPTNGSFVVAGRTYSTTFPIAPGAFQTTCNTCNNKNKAADGFVTKFVVGDQIWPLTLNFGNQVVGVNSPVLNAVLTNSSSTLLHVTSFQVSGTNSSDFIKTNDTCGSPIPVGSSCTISVQFKPSAIGVENATLTVTDDASNSPQQVILQGTGTYVQVTPPSIAFPRQKVGTQSLSKRITVSNKGNVTVNITGIALTGTNAGDFGKTTTCGSTLAPGTDCFIDVTFTPTATGTRTAGVSVSDDGGGSPQLLSLTGVGT